MDNDTATQDPPIVRRRGGFRNGAGRPYKKMSLKVGDSLFVTTKVADGTPVHPSELWEVIGVTRSEITFRSNDGGTIKMRR